MEPLTLAILLHGLLGSALACAVFAVGLGCVGRLPRGELFAYPPGLLLVTIAAFLVLLEPWLAPVAATALVAPLVLLARARTAEPFRRAARPVAWSLLPGLALAFALGRLNHGPTETLASSAYGDMLFYAAKLVAATQSLFPFRDLTVAGEEHVFVESSWVLVGGALSSLPGFDPILFQACTAPAFLVTAVAIGVGLLLERSAAALILPGILAVGAVPYPSWITETPPVVLAVPLVFALYGLWRVRLPPAALGALLLVVGLDVYLTKGFAVVPLTVVSAVAIARGYSRRLVPFLLGGAALAAAGGLVFALTSAWLVEFVAFDFLVPDAVEGLWSQLDRRSTQQAAPALILAGQLVLAVALARCRAYTFLAALVVSMLGNWLLAGHRLDITVGLSVLLAALFFADFTAERSPRALIAASAGALTVSAWFRDVAGARAGFVLVALLAAAFALAFAPVSRPAILGAAATGVVALGLGLGERRATLGPDDHAVWNRVRDVVPADGIVFTSLTGDVIAGDQGWNYYPGLAGRQVYLAGWSNSPLLVDDAERRRRLDRNRRVLSGTAEPRSVGGGRGPAFAVLRASERAPDSFGLLYRNDAYALYFVGSGGT